MATEQAKLARARQVQDKLEEPMLIAAFLVIPAIIIEESHINPTWDSIAYWLNWGIWLAFLAELVIMLVIVPNRFRWLLRHPLEVAIVVLTPPFMPAALQSARAIRLLRLIRVLRAQKLVRQIFSINGLYYAAFLAALVTVIGGFAFQIVEKNNQPLSTWDGLYWALTTVTTIGSNIEPNTDLGRIIALTVLFAGTGFVALLTAAFAQQFLAAEKKKMKELSDGEKEIIKRLDKIEKRLNRKG